ncbi:MAG: ubiquinol-cytochrome c reductase iron-sulfur subunit [Bacteroidales bacterium]|nr:ubiquinol-cytochrome c reductase iron-sulfur subunit [Bacteroidales bacterium]
MNSTENNKSEMHSVPEECSVKESPDNRRNFLKKIWGVFGIVAGAESIAALAGFFKPGKKLLTDNTPKFIVAGNVKDFQLNSVFPFRSGKFYLVRLDDGGFMAISLKCTHLGCSVIWNEAKKEFICPCHASSFNTFGEVMKAPAPRALDVFHVIIEEGKVKVDVSKVIRRNGFDKTLVTYA